MRFLLLLGFLSSTVARIWAQASPGTDLGANISQLLNFGMLGLVLVLLLTGNLSVGAELKHARKEVDDAREDARKLRDAVIEDVVPAMTRMNDLAARMVDTALRRDQQ